MLKISIVPALLILSAHNTNAQETPTKKKLSIADVVLRTSKLQDSELIKKNFDKIDAKIPGVVAGLLNSATDPKTGLSPLGLAVKSNNITTAQSLMTYGANPNIPLITPMEQMTLLHQAIRAKSSGMVNILIQQGALVNIPDQNGKTPLQLALDMNNKDTVLLLLAHGANPDFPDTSDEGKTALHKACEFGDVDIIKSIAVRSKNVNAIDFKGDTPLMLAIKKHANNPNAVDTVRSLRTFGAKLDAINPFEHTAPIHELIKTGDANLIRAANPSHSDLSFRQMSDGKTAFAIALDEIADDKISPTKGIQVIDVLKHEFQAPINIPDFFGKTAIDIAQTIQNKKVIIAFDPTNKLIKAPKKNLETTFPRRNIPQRIESTAQEKITPPEILDKQDMLTKHPQLDLTLRPLKPDTDHAPASEETVAHRKTTVDQTTIEPKKNIIDQHFKASTKKR